MRSVSEGSHKRTWYLDGKGEKNERPGALPLQAFQSRDGSGLNLYAHGLRAIGELSSRRRQAIGVGGGVVIFAIAPAATNTI
jgi:hypothetical protein